MEEKKTEQYTFGPEEKEILEKLNTVESSVGEYIQTKYQRELIATKYYSELVINTSKGEITLNDVFITAEQDSNGEITYHFRWIVENDNGEKSIEERMVIDSSGKVFTSGGLKDYLENSEINIEELFAQNDVEKGRLKGISDKTEEKDISKKLEQNSEKENEVTSEENVIDEELKEQGQDLELTKIRKIKDLHVAERMPEVFGGAEEHAQAFSRKLNRFVMIEKVNGKWQLNESVEPAKMTWRSVIIIDKKGEKIERKVPYALMKTNREDKEIAVNIGQYGEISIETVDVLPCQERVARGVREDGQGQEGEESSQVRREFNTSGKEYTHELAQQVEKIENDEKEAGQEVDMQISESDYIPNTDTTWKELMEETGDSLPNLVERYNNEMSKSGGKEEPKSIIQRIIDDYQMVFHEHRRH